MSVMTFDWRFPYLVELKASDSMEQPFDKLERVLDSEIHCGYDDGAVSGGLTT